ncbi:unnamed protein product [Chondrus crispus]|uniref:Nucleotide-diphospho-sugar transferase domain-containing protein n=1 Tax=Chondrus crispus TaxID=2769 RepID=R7QP33_CHOCR|nr:unnamed protein product [Chondrus crispus]CDF39246.1 unnamed protein product [Chondrus crispus]|eukprot:XP_005719157.1 unnamed protein product [Chondrus crispus]
MYKPVACTCPDPGRSDCNLCSKLHFMRDLLMQEREFVFLDSDVTVLHRDFLERLAIRARGFDFLASYGFAVPCATKLMRPFNSGVFFMRWIEGVDYQKLLRLPWELRSNNDQNALSAFVQREYREWDVLGMQWHCRFLAGGEVRIPAERCYTVHGRGPVVKEVMERANRTWLKVG